MRRKTIFTFLPVLVVVQCLLFGQTVEANYLDLSIARFVTCNDTGTQCSPRLRDYERFMAEYAFGLSPKTLTPADSLGYSGFYIGFEGAVTPLPSSYGQQSSKDRWTDGTAPYGKYPQVMFMPGIRVRKGLPWSVELGGSANFLARSSTVALGGEIKWSLFEGYRRGFGGFLPDVAARGSVMRILGQTDVDMTIIGVDGTMSYDFGVGGMISLSPYMGYQHLFTIVRTEPLVHRDDSKNPEDVVYHSNDGRTYDVSGLSGPNLQRSRLFWGLRFRYELLSLLIEGSWGLPKKWKTAAIDEPENDTYVIDETQLESSVGNQLHMSFGIGMDF